LSSRASVSSRHATTAASIVGRREREVVERRRGAALHPPRFVGVAAGRVPRTAVRLGQGAIWPLFGH
jgi:hypothetical protein